MPVRHPGEVVQPSFGGEWDAPPPSATLADRFTMPPFSVLDARSGEWQARKRLWLELGIKSELGRGETTEGSDMLTSVGEHVAGDGLNYYRDRKATGLLGFSKEAAEAGLNHYRNRNSTGLLGQTEQAEQYRKGEGTYRKGISGSQRLPAGGGSLTEPHTLGEGTTRNGYGSSSGKDGKSFRIPVDTKAAGIGGRMALHAPAHPYDEGGPGGDVSQSGTSIFDPVLTELVYRWFCPPGGQILDPFAGGSVRGIVASILGRAYTGVDLSERQIAANRAQWPLSDGPAPATLTGPRWIVGDSRALPSLAHGAYDLIFTCPPYHNLERYSDDPRDLSVMDWAGFCRAYREIIGHAAAMLRPDRFACIIVGDVRDTRGHYRGLPGETIAAFAAAGMPLYNEAVLVTMVGSLPIRVGRQFVTARKLGKTHQNLLVFVKGNAQAAAQECERDGVAP